MKLVKNVVPLKWKNSSRPKKKHKYTQLLTGSIEGYVCEHISNMENNEWGDVLYLSRHTFPLRDVPYSIIPQDITLRANTKFDKGDIVLSWKYLYEKCTIKGLGYQTDRRVIWKQSM